MAKKAKSAQKRVSVKDLPKQEQKLSQEEQQKVRGGEIGSGTDFQFQSDASNSTFQGGVRVGSIDRKT